MRVPLAPWLLGAALAVGCGSRADLSTPSGWTPDGAVAGDAPDVVWSALSVNDCGPADGPATTFVIAPSSLECAPSTCGRGPCLPPQPPTRDVIWFYGDLPDAPTGTTLAFDATGPNGRGDASSCRAGQCASASHVVLDLTTFSRTAAVARGTYVLTLADGSRISGAFDGAACSNSVTCG